ncbi:MAG: hypothetical protein E6I80_10355 [Chloroflexi bacterium]|nr:MAG: hypothetical protein E6I80_10355 [Chloroflexota bacterium]
MKSRVFLLVCLITLVFILGTLWSIHDELPTIAHDVLDAVAVVSALGALFATWRLYLEVRKHALLVKEHKQRLAHEQRRLSMEEERHQQELTERKAQQEHEATLHTAKLALLQREAWLREHLALSRAGYDANGNPPIFLGSYQGKPTITTLPPGNPPRGQIKGAKDPAPLFLGSGQDMHETQEAPIALPTAPAFREMCHLISRDRLILCYTASGPAYGTVDDLLSMAVTGKPGRGKTTALMYYVTILLSIGAEVIIWDPHGAMGELALLNGKRLSGLPATARVIYLDRKEEIIDSIAALHEDLAERDALYRPPQRTVKHPRLLLADELPVLADYDDELARVYKKREEEAPSLIKVIRRYVLEARKWRCFFIGSGQSMDAEILPTRVTESLNSRIVFFSSDRRARMAGLENEAVKKYLPLIRRAGSGIMIFDCAPQMTDLAPNAFRPSEPLRNGETLCETDDETPQEAEPANVIQGPFRVSERGDGASAKREGVRDETKRAILKMQRDGIALRDIARYVHLSGEKYPIFQEVCRELGIVSRKVEGEH